MQDAVAQPAALFEFIWTTTMDEHIIRRVCCDFQARRASLEMSDRSASNETDIVLIERIADEDRDAFKEFYALYQRRLFAYLTKLLSEHETVEEVFNDEMFEVWRQAGNFLHKSTVATWVFGIAHNRALNARRTQGKRVVVDLEEAKRSGDQRGQCRDAGRAKQPGRENSRSNDSTFRRT